MSIISVALVLFCSLVAANASHCTGCGVSTTLQYLNGLAHPQECRFKIIDGATNNRKGLELSGYGERSVHLTGVALDTQWCPGSSRIVVTESPAPSEGWGYFKVPRCCAAKVLDVCYHKVVVDLNCSDAGNADDAIQRVEVTYRNREAGKRVSVVFHAHYGKVDCTNDFDSTYEYVYYGNGATSQVKYCGDSDINVNIRRYTHPGTGEVILETSRYSCLSQYVRMFVQAAEPNKPPTTKFTLKTELDRSYHNTDSFGTKLNAVLGETHQGRCGAIVDNIV